MNIFYSEHAKKRLKERGILEKEIEFIMHYPDNVRKSSDGRKEAEGCINNRRIKVVFVERESYINIITVI